MPDEPSTADHTQVCPQCGAAVIDVVEDVSDEVTVYGCRSCEVTWARRRDPG